jgi:hypothetical protein
LNRFFCYFSAVEDYPVNVFSVVKDFFGAPERLKATVDIASVLEAIRLIFFRSPIRGFFSYFCERFNKKTITLRGGYTVKQASPILVHYPIDFTILCNHFFSSERDPTHNTYPGTSFLSLHKIVL